MLPLIDSAALPDWLRGVLNGLIFIVSLVLLERSADAFVDSTAVVARRFGLPTVLIGLLTVGAEWEELAVVISSLGQNNPSLALSNIYGSSIANILGSFSIGLLFSPSALQGVELLSARIYTSLLVVLSVIIAILGIPPVRNKIGAHAGEDGLIRGRIIGGLLVSVFIIYVAAIALGIYRGTFIAPEGSDSEDEESEDTDTESEMSDDEVVDSPRAVAVSPSIRPPNDRTPLLTSLPPPLENARPPPWPMRQKPAWYHITRIVAATLFLSVSGYLLSSSTTTLAILIGLSQSTIGLTLLSIATTLPEKLVAFKAGSKKQTGVLVANTVGSNVFLGTLVLGIVYLVRGEAAYDSENRRNSPGPLSMLPPHSPDFEIEGRAELADVLVMLSAALALWTMVWYGKLRRWMGVAMLVTYVAYLVSVVLRSKL